MTLFYSYPTMKKFYVILSILFCVLSSHAQNSEIDSLKNALAGANLADTTKIDLYLKLSSTFFPISIDSSELYTKKAEFLSKLSGYYKIDKIYGNKGLFQYYAANQDLSVHARHLSYEIASTQEQVVTARTEAETLKAQYHRAQQNLENAESAITIAERRLWDSLETIRDGFAVFDPQNTLVAANRAYLAVFDGLEMVRPGIHMNELMSLLAEEGIVDTGGLKPRAWCDMMLDRLNSHRIDPSVLKIWNYQPNSLLYQQ